jgi:hypothetical protein
MTSATLERMQKLMPRLDQYGRDSLRDLSRRLIRSFNASWPSMSDEERKAEAKRINEQLDFRMTVMEKALSGPTSTRRAGTTRGVSKPLQANDDAPGDRNGFFREYQPAVGLAAAVDIATRHRIDGGLTPDNRRCQPFKVSDEKPTGLLLWNVQEEPSWYVWFSSARTPLDLVSSTVVVVSQATGNVTYVGSANDEG